MNNTWVALILVVFISGLVLLPASPALQPIPGRDSGMFLYIGSGMLRGLLPYRDIWDHKPPLIYLIDAVGLILGGGTRWGVWVIEWLSLSAAGWLALYALSASFSRAAAWIALVGGWLSLPVLLEGGNLTEEYGLLFQFAALLVFIHLHNRPGSNGVWLMNGVLLAAAVLLKPTLVGIWLAGVLAILISSHKPDRARIHAGMLWIALGVGLVLSVVAAAMAFGGILPAFWDAFARFNRTYTTIPLPTRLLASLVGLAQAALISGVILTALVTWFSLVLIRLRQQLLVQPPLDQQSLSAESYGRPTFFLLLGWLAFLFELLILGISGRNYLHYFISLLPAAMILTAGLLFLWQRVRVGLTRLCWIGLVAIFMLIFPTGIVAILQTPLPFIDVQRQAVVDFIRAHTIEGDPVLIWGAEAGVLFASGVRTPTRFVYQYPLYHPSYRTTDMLEQFISQVSDDPPVWVIDSKNPEAPFPIEGDAWTEAYWEPWALEFFQNYTLSGQVGPESWSIYHHNGYRMTEGPLSALVPEISENRGAAW